MNLNTYSRVAKYFIKSKNEGWISKIWKSNTLLVGDTGLHYIILVKLKKIIPRYKHMFGCEV